MKKLLATILAAAAIAAPAAQAKHITHLTRTNLDFNHFALAVTAHEATGVTIKINPADCFEQEKYLGWYWNIKNEIVVCQQEATRPGVEVYWTAEDLDTLRHEVHHLVQDCRDGALRGDLDAVYKEPVEMAVEWLGKDYARHIAKTYADQGEHTVVMELEAFTVAAMNDPLEQIQDVKNFCS